MIISELINDGTLIRHCSDAGKYIVQVETSDRYGEAIDIVPCPFTYKETDEYIDEVEPMSETEQKVLAYDILMGVSE